MALPFLSGSVGKGKDQKDYLRKIISDTLTLLCKNSLQFDIGVTIEGLLGITVDNNEIFLVNINERLDDLDDEDTKSTKDNKKIIKNKTQLPPLIPLKRIKHTPKKRKRSPNSSPEYEPPHLEIEHPPEDEPCLGNNAVSDTEQSSEEEKKEKTETLSEPVVAIKAEPVDAGYEVASGSQAVFPEPLVQSVTGAAVPVPAPVVNQTQVTGVGPFVLVGNGLMSVGNQATQETVHQQPEKEETDENGFEIVMDEQGQMHLKPRKIVKKSQDFNIVAPLPAENQFTPSINLQVLPNATAKGNQGSILGTILQGKEPFNQVQSCSFVKGVKTVIPNSRKQLRPLKIRPIMTYASAVTAQQRQQANPPAKKTMFECKTCGKLLGNKKTLSRHQMLHLGRRFTCGICGHAYTRKDNLARHYLTRHETEMPADIKPVILKVPSVSNTNDSLNNSESVNHDESGDVNIDDDSMNIDDSNAEEVSFANVNECVDESVDEGMVNTGESEDEEGGGLMIDEEGEKGDGDLEEANGEDEERDDESEYEEMEEGEEAA